MKNNCNDFSVCVLLASYNGGKFIQEQIESILNQEDVNVSIIIRDDGSKDNTKEILDRYMSYKNIQFIQGENVGPAKNFYELINLAPDSDFYAFADQDDVWDSDKLKMAIKVIGMKNDVPILYYSASRTVDINNNMIGIIGSSKPSLTYGSSLVRSNAQGATFVFNKNLLEIAKLYYPDFKRCGILHDAWLHKVCLSVGGLVIHDPKPHMSYRIHGNNVIAKISTNKISDRMNNYLKDSIKNYNSIVAKEILTGYEYYLTKENYKLTYDLAYYKKSMKSKIRILFSSKYKVGVFKEDLRFRIKILLNRA